MNNRRRTYQSWYDMKRRCLDPTHKDYKHYGGRGILVHPDWSSFGNFINDMGERPDRLTLDRKDNDGNYEKMNCRWASRSQQQNNCRRTRLVTCHGITKSATQWSKFLGVTDGALFHYATYHGLTLEAAISRRCAHQRAINQDNYTRK